MVSCAWRHDRCFRKVNSYNISLKEDLMPILQIKGEGLSLPLASFWWVPAVLEVPWFVVA